MKEKADAELASALEALAGVGIEDAVALVTLGSGHASPWRGQAQVTVPYAELPGWSVPGVPGHHGNLGLVRLGAMNLLVMEGRHHYYEARSYEGVVFPLRVASALGVRLAVLTNSAGSLRPDLEPGEIVLTAGHLFLQGAIKPGYDSPERNIRSGVYWEEGRTLMVASARRAGIGVREGVLACVGGPSYETVAEGAMLKGFGADVVSMSLAPEALAASSMGLKVVGLSIVTNVAPGVAASVPDHDAVVATAALAQPHLDTLLREAVPPLIALLDQGAA